TPDPRRASGILLHPTSLPFGLGVGDLGRGAFGFVDFLATAGQTLWQIMPLGPVGLGNSPYAARSAFAGNPLLVDLEALVERGWLDQTQLAAAPTGPTERVRYDEAMAFKQAAIGQAYQRFRSLAPASERTEFERFCAQHASWLDDFALFIAIKEVHDGRA